MRPAQVYAFSREDFDYLRNLVSAQTGISLAENKYDMLYGRLARRVRSLGLADFAAYVRLIRDGHPGELEELINAVTTGLTGFFREPHHFAFLAEQLEPTLRARQSAGGPVRIWSAGCSTGEEPYSIAITLLETLGADERWQPQVLATDLDTRALARASAGIYPLEAVRDLSPARLRRWFLRGRGRREGQVRLREAARALVSFRKLNLMEDWGLRGGLDAVFCRNVMIYFDRDTKRRLLSRLHHVLRPDGLLFIGHAESLVGQSEQFVAVGRTTYRAR